MVMGSLVLEGGAEFGGRMSEPDLRALELAGGLDSPVRIIPAAAAPDKNQVRAGNNGLRWFKRLGARDVEVVYVIDRSSAAEARLTDSLRKARLVYLLGGFPRHLAETLHESRAWESVLKAWQDGAVIAGSSAGAMVLCGYYYDPYQRTLLRGLNLLPDTCVIPHQDTSGRHWAGLVGEMLPNVTLIGIDEATGIVRAGGSPADEWSVHGAGQVVLRLPEAGERQKRAFTHGQVFSLPGVSKTGGLRNP